VSLADIVDSVDAPRRSLALVNRNAPDEVRSMLHSVFDGQPIVLDDLDVDDAAENVVILLDEADTVIASSPLVALQRSILFVNSDLYITGTKGLADIEVPDVIDKLDEVPFSLRGYPESNKEKLLLILISRHIERIAWEADGGTLRTSFQELSRIDDERGTESVYRQLADTDTDVHVYGVPDWTPPPSFGVTMHGGYTEPFQTSWFVVFTPEEGQPGRPAALVALETRPRYWNGFWTYDPDHVAAINRHIERTL
jgi:hypothetical protein